MESQPQNPEFRNNPENFHSCLCPNDHDLTAQNHIIAVYFQDIYPVSCTC